MKPTTFRSITRTFVLALALAGGVCAADATPAAAATIGGAAEPAVNETFLSRASDLSSRLLGEADGALKNAKSVGGALGGIGSFGGAGAKADSATATAQAAVDKATGLKSDIDALRAGKPISSTGVYATLTSAASNAASKATGGGSSSGGSSFTDAFKGLPMASVMQTVLGNPDISKAILAATPVDKVPGYATATEALSKAGL
jgi:hypothetical protein